LRRSLTVWVIWFCSFFCTFGLTTWLPSLYTSVFKLPLATAIKYGLMVQFANYAGAWTCAFITDKLGRKKVFAGSFFFLAVFMLALWLQGATSAHVILVLCIFGSYWNSWSSLVLWLYTPEVYPTRMRALGCGVGTAWYRLAVVIAPILVGVIITHYSQPRLFMPYIFAMFGFVALFASVITALFAVETKNRVLEEVSP